MNCGEFKRFADAYVDRELGGDEGAVSAHMSECPECRKWVEVVKRARAVVKEKVVKAPAPDALASRIRGALNGGARQ